MLDILIGRGFPYSVCKSDSIYGMVPEPIISNLISESTIHARIDCFVLIDVIYDEME